MGRTFVPCRPEQRKDNPYIIFWASFQTSNSKHTPKHTVPDRPLGGVDPEGKRDQDYL